MVHMQSSFELSSPSTTELASNEVVIRVFEEDERRRLFDLIKSKSAMISNSLGDLSSVYQNEMNIDESIANDYLSSVQACRELMFRSLKEIECLFKDCCREHLVEKTFNQYNSSVEEDLL